MEIKSNFFKVESSGRINLIGEHTDHQFGFVLPVAINAKITLYGSKRHDNTILAYSDTYNEKFSILIDELENFKSIPGNWSNFVVGIFKWFNNIYTVKSGCNIIITSNLPQGAGLSSSAALEIGLTILLENIYVVKLENIQRVKLCWDVENTFIGVKCGIMDQFIVNFGLEHTALKINCTDLTFETVKLPLNMRLLVIDTNIKHSLIDTPYNIRIEECEIALKKIISLGFNITNLSELTLPDFQKISENLENPYSSRVKHVITENTRVNTFFNILQNKHNLEEHVMFEKLGKLLYESHASLQNDFKASWDRADNIVEFCKSQSDIYGARMVGGGWGGSVLVLVDDFALKGVIKKLEQWFMEFFQEKTSILQYEIANGIESEKILFNEIPNRFEKYFS